MKPINSTGTDTAAGRTQGQQRDSAIASRIRMPLFFGWNRQAAEKLLLSISTAGAALVPELSSAFAFDRVAELTVSALLSNAIPGNERFQGWPRDAAFKLILQANSTLQ